MSREPFVEHVGTYSPYLKGPYSWRQLSPACPPFLCCMRGERLRVQRRTVEDMLRRAGYA